MNRVSLRFAALIPCLAACAVESADPADTLDLTTVEQAATLSLSCTVREVAANGVATSPFCQGAINEEGGIISASFNAATSTVPVARRRFQWRINGAPVTNNTPSLYTTLSSDPLLRCDADSPGCQIVANRACFNERTFIFQVLVFDRASPSSQPVDTGTIEATLRPSLTGCGLQACLVPPTPVMSVQSDLCFGQHSKSWPPVPGAHSYQVQAKPVTPNRDWSQIPVTQGFPGLIVNGPFLDCPGSVSSTSVARIRACNDCGCSPWSADVGIPFVRSCL